MVEGPTWGQSKVFTWIMQNLSHIWQTGILSFCYFCTSELHDFRRQSTYLSDFIVVLEQWPLLSMTAWIFLIAEIFGIYSFPHYQWKTTRIQEQIQQTSSPKSRTSIQNIRIRSELQIPADLDAEVINKRLKCDLYASYGATMLESTMLEPLGFRLHFKAVELSSGLSTHG